MKKLLIVFMILFSFASFMLVGCTSGDEIIVGYDNHFPPMGFVDSNGKDVGFDLDLATAVGEVMGKKIKFQAIDWSKKETELISKQIDVIWNGYTITEERKEKINFCTPYLKNDQVILVKKDSNYNDIASLTGKTLIFQSKSSAEDAIKSNDLLKNNKVVEPKDNMLAILELDAGNGEAIVLDSVVAGYILKQGKNNDKYRVLADVLATEQYGIGLRKEDTALLEAINKALVTLKENGKLKEISDKWGLTELVLI